MNKYKILISDIQNNYQNSITYQLLDNPSQMIEKKIPLYRLQKHIIKINPEIISKEKQIKIYNDVIDSGIF